MIRIICEDCGAEFTGGSTARYCPNCRLERQREGARKAREHVNDSKGIYAAHADKCSKAGRCKYGENCPHEWQPPSDWFPCFDTWRQNRFTESTIKKPKKKSKARKKARKGRKK